MSDTPTLLISYSPFNVTSTGVLRAPDILPQTILCTENAHSLSSVVG